MSDTPKRSKRKASKAVIEVAEAISTEVAPPVAEEVKEAKPEPVKKVEEPVVEEAKVAQKNRSVKIKAIKTMRGQVGPFIYDIKAGETYTLPPSVAHWLIEKGRAV